MGMWELSVVELLSGNLRLSSALGFSSWGSKLGSSDGTSGWLARIPVSAAVDELELGTLSSGGEDSSDPRAFVLISGLQANTVILIRQACDGRTLWRWDNSDQFSHWSST